MAEGRDEQRDEHLAKAMRFVAVAETAGENGGDPAEITAFASLATAHAAIAAAIPPEPLEVGFAFAGDVEIREGDTPEQVMGRAQQWRPEYGR